MKQLFLTLLLVGSSACAQKETVPPENLASKVDMLIEQDMYTEAFEMLEGQEETPEVLTLKEKTHLNYGLFLEYRDSDIANMRDKMNGALTQYIEVLKINKDNEKAISEIEQILGVYASFPDRSPDEAIVAELKELGFEI